MVKLDGKILVLFEWLGDEQYAAYLFDAIFFKEFGLGDNEYIQEFDNEVMDSLVAMEEIACVVITVDLA